MKDTARIGERVSALTNLSIVQEDSIGDLYIDGAALDFPRLLFAKLKRADPNVAIEVWHNHFDETVTIVIGKVEATINIPLIISRHLLVPVTDQLVKDILE